MIHMTTKVICVPLKMGGAFILRHIKIAYNLLRIIYRRQI